MPFTNTLPHFLHKLKSSFFEALQFGYSPIPLSVNRVALVPWKSYQLIQPTQEEVEGWFKDYDIYGMAYLMGNGVIHVECDTEEAENWVRQMGIPEGAPEWRSQRGPHWLFADPEQVGFNKTGIFHDIDVKGLGGTANMPPSTIDRMTLEAYYTWTTQLCNKKDLPVMPVWLAERFGELRREQVMQDAARKQAYAYERIQRTKQSSDYDSFSQKRKEAWSKSVLRGELSKLGGANQNESIYKVTSKLICQLVDGVGTYSEAEIVSYVEALSGDYVKRHSQKSLEATINSAIQAGHRMTPKIPDFSDHPTRQPSTPPTHQPTNPPYQLTNPPPIFEDTLAEAQDLLNDTTKNSRILAKRELKNKTREWAEAAGDFNEAQVDELRDVLEELGLSYSDRRSWDKQVKEAQKKAKKEREKREEEEVKREREKVLVGELPSMIVGKQQLRQIVDGCVKHLARREDLYVYGEVLCHLKRNKKGALVIRVLDSDKMPLLLSRTINFFSENKNGYEPVNLPDNITRSIINYDRLDEFPNLKGIVHTPILFEDKEGFALHYARGYLPECELYNASDFDVDPSCIMPSRFDLHQALNTIEVMLKDSLFKSQSDKAHAIALGLQPFVRPSLPECPLFVIQASTEGTGKTYLALCMAYVSGPPNLNPLISAPESEEEWRKQITTYIKAGKPFWIFDNVEGRLKSPSLDRLLTAMDWSDRVLGASELVEFPIIQTFALTANNLKIYKDTLSRSVFINLDANMENPGQRRVRTDIRADIILNRKRYVEAFTTLIGWWLAQGAPQRQESFNRFKKWGKVIGGILDCCGIEGFGESEERQEDEYILTWKALVTWWWEQYQTSVITASKLIYAASYTDDGQGLRILDAWLRDPTQKGRENHLGQMLKGFAKGRVFGKLKVYAEFKGYTTVYWLEDISVERFEVRQDDIF